MSSTSNVYMNWLKLNVNIWSIICSHAKQWQLQATFILQKTQLHLTPVCSGLVLQADQQHPGTQGMSSVAGNEKLLWFSRRNFICTSPDETL